MGSVAEAGPNRIKNGDFESALTPPWNVSPKLEGTVIDTAVKYAGNASLHLIATSAGTTQTNSVWQDTTPLVIGQQYTLSY